MESLISAVHVILCLILVLLVMIQSGKGAEISASFGGSSQTVFGSSGGANFFTRFTGAVAALFMVTSVSLTLLHNQSHKSVFEGAPIAEPSATAPATPADQAATPAAPAQKK